MMNFERYTQPVNQTRLCRSPIAVLKNFFAWWVINICCLDPLYFAQKYCSPEVSPYIVILPYLLILPLVLETPLGYS